MRLMSPWTPFLDFVLYGDLVYRNVSEQSKNIVNRYTRTGYNIDIMQQTACLIFYTTRVDSYAFLFNCTTMGGLAFLGSANCFVLICQCIYFFLEGHIFLLYQLFIVISLFSYGTLIE